MTTFNFPYIDSNFIWSKDNRKIQDCIISRVKLNTVYYTCGCTPSIYGLCVRRRVRERQNSIGSIYIKISSYRQKKLTTFYNLIFGCSSITLKRSNTLPLLTSYQKVHSLIFSISSYVYLNL